LNWGLRKSLYEISNCKIKATSGEALLGTGRLVNLVRARVSFTVHLLATLLLIVLALHILKLSRESLNLILVLVDLGLVHVEFGRHGLHLVRLLLKILLVN